MTADVWTSCAVEAYLGLSCHFITEYWQIKTFNHAPGGEPYCCKPLCTALRTPSSSWLTVPSKSIRRAVGAARNLVKHFRKCELAHAKVKVKQQQMKTVQHHLIQDVSIRWNSTSYMLERHLEHCWPVVATLYNPEVTPRGKNYFNMNKVLLEELLKGLHHPYSKPL